MKNLGKIVILLTFMLSSTLFGGVVAKVNSQSISAGEMVTLSLVLSGEDVNKPSLFKVCGYDVVSTSSQTSIKMVNLDYQKSYILSYKFMPQDSCTIEAIEVEIDGEMEKTEPIKIEVKAASKTVDSDFELILNTNKEDVYVGEPFNLTLLFKQKRSTEVVDSKFVGPDLKGFWVKGESKPERYNEGEYTVTKIVYTMAAQREGPLKITPAQMRVATRSNTKDSWGSWRPNVKWRAYFSNNVNINASALPVGVSLVGDFRIKAYADKKVISPNEAININLEVTGSGNFEDIKSFKPYIDGVSVFDEKIVLNAKGLSQKIAFVSDEDFSIPAFTLKYFDLKTKKIKTISTAVINVSVKGEKKKDLILKKDEKEIEQVQVIKEAPASTGKSEISNGLIGIIFFGGLLIGAIITLLKPWTAFNREKTVSIKEPKILLVKLMPYKDDERVLELIDILEKNIYSNADFEIDKKLVKELIEKYQIS